MSQRNKFEKFAVPRQQRPGVFINGKIVKNQEQHLKRRSGLSVQGKGIAVTSLPVAVSLWVGSYLKIDSPLTWRISMLKIWKPLWRQIQIENETLRTFQESYRYILHSKKTAHASYLVTTGKILGYPKGIQCYRDLVLVYMLVRFGDHFD